MSLDQLKDPLNQPFEQVGVSTTTVIVPTNLSFQLQWLYDQCTVIPRALTCRSTREMNKILESTPVKVGSLTLVQYKDQLKGFKPKKQRSRYFRNALSLVMYVGKLVTIKIPSQGKIQITGCTSEEHTRACIDSIWNMVSSHEQGPNTYTLINEKNPVLGDSRHFVYIIDVVMTNKVFKLGFLVNRQNLDQYINLQTEYTSLLETSFGYTGVNIKAPFKVDPCDSIFKRVVYDVDTQKWNIDALTYSDYTSMQPTRHRNKSYRNTFLVFQSGTAIMSGMTLEYMKNAYDHFMTIIKDCKPFIEELIIEP